MPILTPVFAPGVVVGHERQNQPVEELPWPYGDLRKRAIVLATAPPTTAPIKAPQMAPPMARPIGPIGCWMPLNSITKTRGFGQSMAPAKGIPGE